MKKRLIHSGLVTLNLKLTYWWRPVVACLFLLNLPLLLFAQNKIWDKTLGGEQWDQLAAIEQTPDGGYILGGHSSSSNLFDKTEKNRGNNDYWVVKLNADGSKKWDKTIGGTSYDNLTTLQRTSDGGYIAGGWSESGKGADKTEASKGGTDFWIVKLNANGKILWDKTLGGTGEDYLTIIQQTSDGGYILGGDSHSDIGGDKTQANKGGILPSGKFRSDFWLVKLDASGKKLWDKTIGGNNSDHLTTLQQTNEGGYILGGSSATSSNGDKTEANRGIYDYWVVKIKANGTKEWDKTYGGADHEELRSLAITQEGGFILGGFSYSDIGGDKSQSSKGGSDYWIIKLKADGSKEWDKNFGGPNGDELVKVQQTSNGGYVLGGSSYSGKGGDKSEKQKGAQDYWIVRLDTAGTKVWDKTLGSANISFLASLQETTDGHFILGGTSNGYKTGDKTEDPKGGLSADYWIVKLDDKLTRQNQIITFQPIPYQNLGAAPFKLTASSSSKLPITFSVVSGPASISGNTVTVKGLGEVTIKAFQAGNNAYLPAEATRTFQVRNNIEKPWDKAFGGSTLDHLTAMLTTPEGDLLLGGYSASGKSGNKSQDSYGKQDYWLVKTNKAGQKIWDKTYGGSGRDHLTTLLATEDDGYLLGGSSNSGNSGNKSTANRGLTDYWLVKIDKEGTKLWERTYGGLGHDSLTTLITSPDGGYLLGGTSNSGQGLGKSQPSFGEKDFWILKIDAEGNKIWDKTFGGSRKEELASVVTTQNGGYLLGGTSNSNISGEKSQAANTYADYWVVRINENGTKLWDKTYGGVFYEYLGFYYGLSVLSSVVATPDGGFLLGGTSNTAIGAEKTEASKADDDLDQSERDYWVVKINENGKRVWDNVYTGPLNTHPSDESVFFFTGDCSLKTIVPTGDGDYLLAGISTAEKGIDKSENARFEDPQSPQRYDYWVVRIDEKGFKKWDRTIGGTNNEDLATILPLPDGEYVLGGSSSSRVGGDRTQPTWDPSENYQQRSDYWITKIKVVEQPLTTQWDWRYIGNKFEGFTTVIKTTDGGYLSGGYTNSDRQDDVSQTSKGKNDYWIVKSNKEGRKLWDKRFGGSEDDFLNRIIQTKDGGYLLAGSSLSGKNGDKSEGSQGNRDYWLIKTDKDGTKQWDKRFGGSGYDELKKVFQLSTGEFILAGYSNSPAGGDKSQASQGGNDYWLIKISSTGSKIWDKRYGSSNNETLTGIVATANGGLLLGGSSLSGKNGDKTEPSRGSSDFWVVSVDKNGNALWDKTYGGSGQDEAYSLGRGANDTYFISGQSNSPAGLDKTAAGQGNQDFWLIKLDAKGAKLWDKTFGGSQDDELRASIFTQDGGYLLAGSSNSGKSGDKSQDSQGASDYWIVKTDADGKLEWDKRFGGNGTEELRAVTQTPDGGYLLGGRTNSNVSGDVSQLGRGTDYWLIKLAPDQTSILAARQATVLPADDLTLTKKLPVHTYPNPFREKVNVQFTLPQTEATTVKVFDSQGREVTTLFNGQAQANQTYQIEWQALNKPAGLYFLQLQTPSQRQQQKLLLTK